MRRRVAERKAGGGAAVVLSGLVPAPQPDVSRCDYWIFGLECLDFDIQPSF
jgi:hypothetical protein